jgi:alcohol dehydrogenase class IV
MIETVMAWNIEAADDQFEELAHVCQSGGGGPGFVRWLGHLKQQVGITGTLSSHGVSKEQVPWLVEIAVKDICHQTNPRPVTAQDFERLFLQAM